jgi:flagellar hook-basal body complex protein FliE
MSIGAIDTSRIEAMVAQLKAAAARTSPANANPVGEAGLKNREVAAPAEFHSFLKTSLDHVNQVQNEGTQLAQRFEMGDSNVSLSDAMIALQKSSIALQQTIQVRNKLVSAYQEIMSMGV